ncbi:hypothetical protein H4CHR_01018 [Variovorax sp. PBS-H4]|uniref:hypothetical protein n=1 Tax=Variovorax sp. PBS-H4 TaxID=434008 RepID=UPI001318475E|nr:hypothetical protein [Variovorax sp. PBS-H4]VTU22584.1 hypothetical protein H4CHR_01018 [Variovorax sp. PBS-H4]
MLERLFRRTPSDTGNNARRCGTWKATGGDSGKLGPPSEQLSGSNQPREKDPPGTTGGPSGGA